MFLYLRSFENLNFQISKTQTYFLLTKVIQIKNGPTSKFYDFWRWTTFILVIWLSGIVVVTFFTVLVVPYVTRHHCSICDGGWHKRPPALCLQLPTLCLHHSADGCQLSCANTLFSMCQHKSILAKCGLILKFARLNWRVLNHLYLHPNYLSFWLFRYIPKLLLIIVAIDHVGSALWSLSRQYTNDLKRESEIYFTSY
jgi:hypothetical protein